MDNNGFDKWYGEGSPDGEDAFEKKWGSEVLWINPPFNMFHRVLDKIIQDKAHAVLLVPKWTKHKFFWKAWGLAVDAVMVPKGAVMFERKGNVQKGVRLCIFGLRACTPMPALRGEGVTNPLSTSI